MLGAVCRPDRSAAWLIGDVWINGWQGTELSWGSWRALAGWWLCKGFWDPPCMAGGPSSPFLPFLHRTVVLGKPLLGHLFIHSFIPYPPDWLRDPAIVPHDTPYFSKYCIDHTVGMTFETRNSGLQGGERRPSGLKRRTKLFTVYSSVLFGF